MFWNPYMIPALLGGVLLYFAGRKLIGRTTRPAARWALVLLAGFLCLPGLAFILYYFHLMPTPWWYVEFRALPGIETLSACWGLLFGLLAAWMLPARHSAVLSLLQSIFRISCLLLILAPFLKPVMFPVEANGRVGDEWKGRVCVQTTVSTCGPASMATIYRYLGIRRTEREIARSCYSCASGTELWYLLRDARAHGLHVSRVRTPELADAPLPSLISVDLGDPHAARAGHFMVLLDVHGRQIAVGDPLTGTELTGNNRMPSSYGGVHDIVAFTRKK